MTTGSNPNVLVVAEPVALLREAAPVSARLPSDPADPNDPPSPGPGYPPAKFALNDLAAGKVFTEPRLGLKGTFAIFVQSNDNPIAPPTVSSDTAGDVFSVLPSTAAETYDLAWEVVCTLPSPGPRVITLTAAWTHVLQTNPPRTKAETWTESISVTVAPTDRVALSHVVLGSLNLDPTAPPAFSIPTSGISLPVSVVASSPTRDISFKVYFGADLISSGALVPDAAATNWSSSPPGVVLPGFAAPWPLDALARGTPWIDMIDTDFFGVATPTRYEFATVDETPPEIEISQPAEGQVFAFNLNGGPASIQVTGTLSDSQSGIAPGTQVSCALYGEEFTTTSADGRTFAFTLPIRNYGELVPVFSARDRAKMQSDPPGLGNLGSKRRQFTVASTYKSRTVEELVSEKAYLFDLLRFSATHLLDRPSSGEVPPSPGEVKPSSVDSSLLTRAFIQAFGALGEPGSDHGSESLSDLVIPIRLLRQLAPSHAIDFPGLLARYRFDAPPVASGPLKDAAVGFGVDGAYVGAPPAWQAEPLYAGALAVDKVNGARIDKNLDALGVGADDRDFGVSFWICLRRPFDARERNVFASVLCKGLEIGQRTFGIWMRPDSDRVHFRVSTVTNSSAGGDSNVEVPIGQWVHLACVKTGERLQLYVAGRLDAEAFLASPVIGNAQPLWIGAAPTFETFEGGIADVRIYGCALSADDALQLATTRYVGADEHPLAVYHRAAHEALLRGMGTSLEQLRAWPVLSPADRTALALRLGLAPADDPSRLLQPPAGVQPGQPNFDDWLESTFGLPSTRTAPSMATPLGCAVLSAQQAALSLRWAREDADRASPDVDPDLVDSQDLSPVATEWQRRLASRSAELEQIFATIKREATVSNALAIVLSNAEKATISGVVAEDTAGADIAAALAALHIDRPMLGRFAYYLGLDANYPLTLQESDDVAHLLTQFAKRRDKYPAWVAEESEPGVANEQRLWPTRDADAAWLPGHAKHSLKPWRANAVARQDLETRLQSRRVEWQALADDLRASTLDVHAQTLGALRDGLFGVADLPRVETRFNRFLERWLVDVAAGGVSPSTPRAQAIASLQLLINGVAEHRFGAGHPAAKWVLLEAYADNFAGEWRWMASYDTWRSAVLNFLYPEHALFPELLRKDTNRNDYSAIRSYFDELAKLLPLRPSSIDKPSDDYRSALKNAVTAPDGQTSPAGVYFTTTALALAYQRGGLYALALKTYRSLFDWTALRGARVKSEWLKLEEPVKPPQPEFASKDQWTLDLEDPHTIARPGNAVRWGNPYTRFTLLQVLECFVALGDDAFVSGTLDGRARALEYYLAASDVLALDELRDRQPERPEHVYLPSPLLAGRRAQVEASLRKLRTGLSFLGTPLPAEATAGADRSLRSGPVRPTPYRYRLLLDRAKQLVSIAQQFETQYLSAIERNEAELEKLLGDQFAKDIADQTYEARALSEKEAADGVELAKAQLTRSDIERDGYRNFMLSGLTYHENAQIDALWASNRTRDSLAAIDAASSVASALANAAGSAASTFGASFALSATLTSMAVARGLEQGMLNSSETSVQANGILAAQDRRIQDWKLRFDVANQDYAIGSQQVKLAQDRLGIASQEVAIAGSQAEQAKQVLAFRGEKFTNAAFYDWMAGLLSQVYAFFLRSAAATAQQAEMQLAFERQAPSRQFIKADYWTATRSGDSGASHDARGITGSARLTQDLYALDQYAFSSEHRLLNLSQIFSLARMAQVEFQAFRRTGILDFATTMASFDEGFPGHYMRLIKRVKVSVVALVPPSQGIRATLVNNGFSRVVTGQPGYPTVVVRQEPQLVALTSAQASSGVFDLDMQSDLVFPFEGSGADTTWRFELPPAANPIDFSSLFDVVMTVDYTALFSAELRDRVIDAMPRQATGDRVLSVRREMPDLWYQLANSDLKSTPITVTLDSSSFPPGLSHLAVSALMVTARTTTGEACEFLVAPSVQPSGGAAMRTGVEVTSSGGVVSTRRGAAVEWFNSMLKTADVTIPAVWRFQLSNVNGGSTQIAEQLQNGTVDDIFIVFTFSALRPSWY